MSIEIGIFIAILILIGNAFFVGAEFALVSVRRSNVELKALDGSRLAKILLSAMEDVSLMLAGAQFGVTLCSLVFGAVSEPLVEHALEPIFNSYGLHDSLITPLSFIIALILMVYLHVVIGEMVPKNISLAKSTSSALVLVPPLYYIVKFLSPIIVTINFLANSIIRLFGVKPRSEIRSSFNRDEVAGFVKESRREGLLSHEEERLLSGALGLEQRTIDHIVLPIAKLVLTTPHPTASEIETLCGKTGFSRFPIPDESGELVGYVHLKDLLKLTEKSLDKKLPSSVIRPLTRVKSHTSLRDALAAMQQSSAHIALVADEKKKMIGVVMLEDVLEELVGPISDTPRKMDSRASS